MQHSHSVFGGSAGGAAGRQVKHRPAVFQRFQGREQHAHCLANAGGGLAQQLPALGEGNAVGKALEGMARQPEMANTLRTNMILGCAITESTGIYSLVVALVLLFIF